MRTSATRHGHLAFYVFVSVSVAGCATLDPFAPAAQLADRGQCEEAAASLVRLWNDAATRDVKAQTMRGVGAAASVGWTGAGYATGAAITGVSVVVGVTAFCMPVLIVDLGVHKSRGGDLTGKCAKSVGRTFAKVADLDLGGKARAQSGPWRDFGTASYAPLVRGVRRIAACYEDWDTADGFEAAEMQLLGLRDAPVFAALEAADQAAVTDDLERLRRRRGDD
jgi:hypothetical protein